MHPWDIIHVVRILYEHALHFITHDVFLTCLAMHHKVLHVSSLTNEIYIQFLRKKYIYISEQQFVQHYTSRFNYLERARHFITRHEFFKWITMHYNALCSSTLMNEMHIQLIILKSYTWCSNSLWTCTTLHYASWIPKNVL